MTDRSLMILHWHVQTIGAIILSILWCVRPGILLGQSSIPELTTVTELSEAVTRWCIDEASGGVYGTQTTANQVVALNRDGATRWTRVVGPAPVALFRLGDHLVVACQGDRTVWILDELSGNRVHVIQMPDAEDEAGL